MPKNKTLKNLGGRPIKAITLAKKASAAEILGSVDEIGIWREILTSQDVRVKLDAIKYLTDRRDGKAKQAFEHSGADGAPLSIVVKFGDGTSEQ